MRPGWTSCFRRLDKLSVAASNITEYSRISKGPGFLGRSLGENDGAGSAARISVEVEQVLARDVNQVVEYPALATAMLGIQS